jgi:hypothetical protein
LSEEKNFFRGAVLLPFIVPTAEAWLLVEDARPQYNIFNWLGVHLGLFTQGPELAWGSLLGQGLGDPRNAWRGTPSLPSLFWPDWSPFRKTSMMPPRSMAPGLSVASSM